MVWRGGLACSQQGEEGGEGEGREGQVEGLEWGGRQGGEEGGEGGGVEGEEEAKGG